MFSRAEKTFARALVIICALVGIVGYSFPLRSDAPKKIWFDTSGGDVIFDHAYHLSFLECSDCHHDYDNESTPADNEMNCRSCHYYGEARDVQSEDETHTRFIGANCVDCHKEMEMEVACDTCHIREGFAFEESGLVMPSLPESVTFDTDNGKVTFNHILHISEDVGEPCITCHHEFQENVGMEHEKSCRACHYNLAELIPEYDDEYHTRYIGASCANCHDAEDCGMCHEE